MLLVRACLCALLCATLAPRASAGDDEVLAQAASPADALLAEAEGLVAKGRYPAAVATYKKLASAYPDTEAGGIGASRASETGALGHASILLHGPSENRVDVVVMGDGYRLKEQKKFDKTAAVVPTLFKRHHVLGEYFTYHNFLRVNLVSKDSHVDGHGRTFDTALDGHQSGALQGQVAIDRERVERYQILVPEHDDLTIVFVQRGKLGTGGSGIATIGGRADTTLLHEWGHAFARLGDEYATTTGERGSVREAPNVSPSADPARVPWAHWLGRRVRGVGVHEGAAGQVRGAWRPSQRCAMASGTDFCVVCREAMVLRIYELVDPIDGCTPDWHLLRGGEVEEVLEGTDSHHFEVRVMEPAKHALTATWWVLPEAEVPERPEPLAEGYAETDRRARGPLRPIAPEPAATAKRPKRGAFKFEVDPGELAPGRYRVVCRVTDPVLGAKPGRWTWVMEDEHGLLVSERAWWVRIGVR